MFRELVAKRMPLLFPAPELLEAARHSTFADDIDWTTMQLPFETAVFVLPRFALMHPKDGECAFIVYGRIRKGEIKVLPGFRGASSPSDRFGIVAMCPDGPNGPVWYDSVLNASHRTTLKLGNLFYTGPGEESPELPVSRMLDEALDKENDGEFLEELGTIVFGLLLAITARPELVTPARMVKRVGPVHGKDTKEFWEPNIIGRDYHVRRHLPKGGTHASPRLHWRRGHFRRQPCGPGFSERKTIWLEPVLVGAGEKEIDTVPKTVL
jgi:hypothetical protein